MKIFVFEVTEAEVALVSDALGALPYTRVVGLVTKLQAQINSQNDAAAEAERTARDNEISNAVKDALNRERLAVKPEAHSNGGGAHAGKAAQGT